MHSALITSLFAFIITGLYAIDHNWSTALGWLMCTIISAHRYLDAKS